MASGSKTHPPDSLVGVHSQKSTSEATRQEISRALNLLTEPGQIVELRILQATMGEQRFPVTRSGYFSSFNVLADLAIKSNPTAQGVYITLNPVNPDLLARAMNRIRILSRQDKATADPDIVKRRWLPIDLDPVRPSGISSSEEEHQAAIARAYTIKEALAKRGWPVPIVADSGNGAHLLYRVDLPSNDDGLVRHCLRSLAQEFDDEIVKIDQAVFNPARIWKLYGTISRKGDNLPERPHRIARILEAW